MSQTVYLVSYDIGDPERWRNVYRLMKGAGERLQYSVFRCVLSDRRLEELQGALELLVHRTEDQILFVDLCPIEGRTATRITSLGRPYVPEQRKAKIV